MFYKDFKISSEFGLLRSIKSKHFLFERITLDKFKWIFFGKKLSIHLIFMKGFQINHDLEWNQGSPYFSPFSVSFIGENRVEVFIGVNKLFIFCQSVRMFGYKI